MNPFKSIYFYNIALAICQLTILLLPLLVKGKFYDRTPASFSGKSRILFFKRLNPVIYYMVAISLIMVYLDFEKSKIITTRPTISIINNNSKKNILNSPNTSIVQSFHTVVKKKPYLTVEDVAFVDTSFNSTNKLHHLIISFATKNSGLGDAFDLKCTTYLILKTNNNMFGGSPFSATFPELIHSEKVILYARTYFKRNLYQNDTLYAVLKASYSDYRHTTNQERYFYFAYDSESPAVWYNMKPEEKKEAINFMAKHQVVL